MKNDRTDYIPIDDRDPATVRAVILARSSDPGSKPEDMKSQVEQCVDFISTRGWYLAFPPYTYAESRSGMRNVDRPVLDEVLKLAIRGEADLTLCPDKSGRFSENAHGNPSR